jgi:hypothetical protein
LIKDSARNGSGTEIWFLNRRVVVVRARQPFEEWAKGVDESAEDAYDSKEGWTNAYLIPDFEDEEESWKWLEENCDTIFEIELNSWFMDPKAWPEDRRWEVFREWFEVELIELAWDLVDEPLSSEPPQSMPRGEA